MKKKIFLPLLFALTLGFSISACNSKKDSSPLPSPAAPPDLAGQWKQINSNSEDSYHGAIIDGDVIEIYWVSDGGDTRSLYWSGTYDAPLTAEEPYSWNSKKDEEKTKHAMMSSQDDNKTFTYENGQISYSASILGTTSKVRLEKEEWEPGLEIAPAKTEEELLPDNTNESTTSYFSFSFEGIEFSIPSYFEKDEDSTDSEITFTANTEDSVILSFSTYNYNNKDEFDADINKTFNSSDLEVSQLERFFLADLPCVSISATYVSDDIPIALNAVAIYNESTKTAVIAGLASVGNLKYDYLDDYNKLIDTAVLTEDVPPTASLGIRPEFKEAMDSYEAFFDEYVAFMQKFAEADDTLSLLSDYSDYMAQYAEMMEKFSAIGEEDMSAEESLYYLDVSNRVSKKLITAMQ